MMFFNALMILLLAFQGVHAQTLFENTQDTNTGKPPIVGTSDSPNKPVQVQRPVLDSYYNQHVLLNLESLILRGDIQVGYEMYRSNGWSGLIQAHVNPQSDYQKYTGEYGILGGARVYIDDAIYKDKLYLQGLVGFNYISSWDLMVSLEAGHRLQWKKQIYLDLAVVINRSYASHMEDPMAYLKCGLSFGLDKPLLPFL